MLPKTRCQQTWPVQSLEAGIAMSVRAANKREQQIVTCSVSKPRGQLINNIESYLFCFDYGAECSLIKESVTNKFTGKRVNDVIKLTSIGKYSVYSTMQVLSQILIGNFK